MKKRKQKPKKRENENIRNDRTKRKKRREEREKEKKGKKDKEKKNGEKEEKREKKEKGGKKEKGTLILISALSSTFEDPVIGNRRSRAAVLYKNVISNTSRFALALFLGRTSASGRLGGEIGLPRRLLFT